MSVAELEKRRGRQYHARCGYLIPMRITGTLCSYSIGSPMKSAKSPRRPLASLMDVLRVLIERYEDEHVPELAE
jgi:hypothetical protein